MFENDRLTLWKRLIGSMWNGRLTEGEYEGDDGSEKLLTGPRY